MRFLNTTTSDPALLVGLDGPDDAAVYLVAPGVALVQTVDFFTPIVDDARTWGRIAAANALSDVYAMGGKPITALNLVGWPRALDFELLGQVLQGGGQVCAAAGVAIVGGHTVDDPEPKYGLSVTGTVNPDLVVRKTGADPGSALILTKPIGTGIISTGIKEGVARPDSVVAAVDSMVRLNADAAAAMLEFGASAATDVTGYGLMGHLQQMLDQRLDARLRIAAIPILPGAVELAREGVLPGGSKRNRSAQTNNVDAGLSDDALMDVLFDAQTSGGLLIAVAEEVASRLVETLQRSGDGSAAWIGTLVEGEGRIVLE